MARFGYSVDDLRDIADMCLDIEDNYKDLSDETLLSITRTCGKLGKRLQSLLEIVQSSGRQEYRYHDARLNRTVCHAKKSLEEYTDVPSPGSGRWGRGIKGLRLTKKTDLKPIQAQIEDHAERVVDERDTILFAATLQKLSPPTQEQSHSLNPVQLDDKEHRVADRQSATSDAASGVDVIQASEDLADVTEMIQLARLVWQNKANRNRHQRSQPSNVSHKTQRSSSILPEDVSPRIRFADEVVGLIKESRLYSEHTTPQQIIDKLHGMYSNARQLESRSKLSSMPAPEEKNTLQPSRYPQACQHSSPPPFNVQQKELGIHSFPTSLGPKMLQLELDLSPPFRGSFSSSSSQSTERPTLMSRLESFDLPSPARDIARSTSSIFAASERQGGDAPSISSKARSHGSRLNFQQRRRGSFRIESRRLKICLDFEMSDISRSTDGLRFEPNQPVTVLDETSLRKQDTDITIISYHDNNSHQTVSNGTSTHLYTSRKSPIPSVPDLALEGPRVDPTRPYTITFTEPQAFWQGGTDRASYSIPDLTYVFWHADDRDEARSIIFGKDLVSCEEVKQVTFTSKSACQGKMISLWYDAKVDPSLSWSITFPHASKSKDLIGEEEEHEVWGMEHSSQKALEDITKPLVLDVRLADRDSVTQSQAPRKKCYLYFETLKGKENFWIGLTTNR